MILGINSSGRSAIRDSDGKLLCGVTEELMKYVLEKTRLKFEYLSLNDKIIRGCVGCLCCAKDNVCVIEDDWADLRDKMFEADAVLFGAPIYYGIINSLGHAFLERTFSLRHRERFPLAGKINAIIVSGTDEPNPVEDFIKRMFRSNYMAEPIGILRSRGLSQCYQCGYGEQCAAGSVVNTHGFLDEIKEYHLPTIPSDTYKRADILAHRLKNVIKNYIKNK